MKIGLVLAGGGAKGAYQVGVLRALDEAGIKPAVIAGTSIGAFNGVLTLLDSQEREVIWQQLATRHFVKVGWVTALAITVRLAKLWAFLFRASDRARLMLGLLFFFLGLGFMAYLGFLPENTPPSTSLVLSVLIGALVLFTALDRMALFVNRLENRGLSETSRLGRIVQNSIPWARLESSEVEIIVTLANKVPQHICWAPEYLKVNSLTRSEAFRLLVATMALPLIYPRILIAGNAYADGGLGDNTPIFALAELNCDKIYVVHLNPNATARHLWLSFSGSDLRDSEELLSWFTRISMARFEAGKRADEFLFDRAWRARWSATTIAHIYPKRRLGCWPMSAILFSRKSCRRLIALGYWDARRVLDSQPSAKPTADA